MGILWESNPGSDEYQADVYHKAIHIPHSIAWTFPKNNFWSPNQCNPSGSVYSYGELYYHPVKIDCWKLCHTSGTSYISSDKATSDKCDATSVT